MPSGREGRSDTSGTVSLRFFLQGGNTIPLRMYRLSLNNAPEGILSLGPGSKRGLPVCDKEIACRPCKER